jgi:HNH endonuclease
MRPDHIYRVLPILEHPRYFADSLGSIWKAAPKRGWHRLEERFNGYWYVWIGSRRYKVHTLVATTFHGPKPPSATMCRHLNDNKRDHRPENLAWGTWHDNMNDSIRNKGYWRRDMPPSEMQQRVEYLIRQGYTYPSIAKLTGVSLRGIYRIRISRCPEIRHAKGNTRKGRKYA